MTSLQELKKLQEQKYLQHKQHEEKEKEKARLEIEAKMLKEFEVGQEYELLLDKLENTIVEIQTSKDITEIDFYVSSFKTIIETNTKFVECFKEDIANKVVDLVTCVNNNKDSKYDITQKSDTAQNIINNVKAIIDLAQLDKESMGVEMTMDTTEDEELAKKLSLENSGIMNPLEGSGGPNGYRLGDLSDSDMFNEEMGKKLSLSKTIIEELKAKGDTGVTGEYGLGDVSDFNALEDDLDYIQLAAFQNELMDEHLENKNI